jgi:DNA polymerase III alpha subunit (gram-positive type)
MLGAGLAAPRTAMTETYVSVDVETDGPIPGEHSMLSFGAAAFSDGQMIGTFEANLDLLPKAIGHPETLAWWQQNQAAYEATRVNTQPPKAALTRFVEWVEKMPGKPVFVAYPAGFDFLFMYWYMIKFVGRSPFSFSALDIKSYAMAKLDLPYRETTKKNMPRSWFPERPHTHRALDDAIEQGLLFLNMLHAK